MDNGVPTFVDRNPVFQRRIAGFCAELGEQIAYLKGSVLRPRAGARGAERTIDLRGAPACGSGDQILEIRLPGCFGKPIPEHPAQCHPAW